MSIKVATATCAVQLLHSAQDLAELKKLAEHYEHLLARLREAVSKNDAHHADHLTRRALGSFAGKVSAVVRTTKRKPGDPSITLADVKARASMLNPFKPLSEPVRALFKPKPGSDDWRMVLSFGWQRRALQAICADILRVRLPAYDFDYLERGKKGAEGAALRLKSLIEGGGYEYLLTADLKNCFRSILKEGVVKLLPLPAPVITNVLLVQDHDIVKAELPAGVTEEDGDFIPPSLISLYLQADTVAREGLPQGSSVSNLIVSRAVLGPLLAATPYADRLTLYGDDICVATHSEDEAEAILKTLRSLLKSTPAGPLSIGSHHTHTLVKFANYCKYKVKRMPWFYGGQVRFAPSQRSYRRLEQRVREKCKPLPVEARAGRADEYGQNWIKAYPLWQPNDLSRFYLDMTIKNALLNLESQAGTKTLAGEDAQDHCGEGD